MIKGLLKRLFGDPNQKQLQEYAPIVHKINALEAEMSQLSDAQLKAKTGEFRALLSEKNLEAILPEAFAVVREAAKRTLNMRHFDVQLIGGIALHYGKIAEMKTGEGKTLVSTLAAYLNALEGKGIYIVTVNDYLAKRDSQWMGQIFHFLGLSVGLIQSGMPPQERLAAYQCDITYGTNNEFGFDYLRDNLCDTISQCCQIRRHYAIVDEVDSILIDEARTPLIISGHVQESTTRYSKVVKVIKKLQKDQDFTLDEKHKNAVLTEDGIKRLESALNIEDVFSIKNMEYAHIAVQCLRALYLFKVDVDYVIKEGEIIIVDEFTGRLMEGRRYSDGLHQAIEAVEGLAIKEESQTLASVTFQNYFRMFPKLSGMTGTASTEADEFAKIYGLDVLEIPTNQSMIRNDLADIVYKSKKEKFNAILAQIKECHDKQQPVLVGTISIETSEYCAALLKKAGIPHTVLNAKYHEKEAEIIAKAGQPGAVTIATNMAGRGTDIKLHESVAGLGGLFVIGSERHESRRIDNQLRGRAGRQGDPGVSRFYVSLEDELMRLFGSDRIARIMETLGIPDDTPIEHPLITRSIEKAQKKVEQYHFSVRKQVLQYDDVMNRQRETIYSLRRQILEKRTLSKKVQEMIRDIVSATVPLYLENDAKQVAFGNSELTQALFGIFASPALLEERPSQNVAQAIQTIIDICTRYYLDRQSNYTEAIFDEAQKDILLRVIDRKWIDHQHDMDILREGIGLRAWGQKDPLIEYKREAFDLFEELLMSIKKEALELIFHVSIVLDSQHAV